jgi:hypothetical protein
MKKFRNYFIGCITIGLILFLLFYFVQNTIYFNTWDINARGGLALLFGLFCVIVCPVFFIEEDKK